jgi:hypothetical protein
LEKELQRVDRLDADTRFEIALQNALERIAPRTDVERAH